MTERAGVSAFECRACGATYFPRRYFCHQCGSSELKARSIRRATAMETTVVRRAFGQRDPEPRHLATVKADGCVFIVGLDGPITDGAELVLQEVDGAPYGRLPAQLPSTAAVGSPIDPTAKF